jgi:uncharacterized delta-60 repeat protein
MKFFLLILSVFFSSILHAQNPNSLVLNQKIVYSFEYPGTKVNLAYQNSFKDDEKILILHSYGDSGVALRRLLPDGSLDPSFASNGTKLIFKKPCDAITYYRGIVTDVNHNIYLSGENGKKVLVTKLKSNGDIDASFGDNGTLLLATFNNASDGIHTTIKIDKKGNLFVLADYWLPGWPNEKEVELYRLSTDGVLDPSFNLTQKIYQKVTTMRNGFTDLSFDSFNNILVSGCVNASSSYDRGFVVKISENGNYVTSFGNNGVSLIIGTYPRKIVVDSIDNIFVCGFYNDSNYGNTGYLVKLDNNGKMASTFGTNGIINIPPVSTLGDIEVASNGKIYTSGNTRYSSGTGYYLDVRRWLANGTPDVTFGNSGAFQSSRISDLGVLDIHFLKDSSLCIVSNDAVQNYGILIHNVAKNGGYNNSFGTNGITTIDSRFDGIDEIKQIKEDKDGNLFAAGNVYNGSNTDYGIIKVLANGTIDQNFGTNGKVMLNFDDQSSNDLVYGMDINNNGDITLAGTTRGSINYYSGALLNKDGLLKPSFGTAGKTKGNLNENFLIYNSDITNGKITYVGSSKTANYYKALTLVRLNADGTLDTDFNKTGSMTTGISSSQYGTALTVDSENNIYTTVQDENNTGISLLVLKIKNNGSVDSTFGTNGLFSSNYA